MITNIVSLSPLISVNSPAARYVNNGPMAGQMRWNTFLQCAEVSDGSNWQQIGGVATVSVSAEFETIMAWAKEEMIKNLRIKRLAAESVTVAAALAQFNEASEQLQVIMALADKELT